MDDAEKLLFLNIETLATIAESAAPLKRKRGRPRKHAGFDGLGYYQESGAHASHYDSSGSAESSQLPPIEMPPYEEDLDQDFDDSAINKNDEQPAQKRGRGRPPKVKRLGEIEELMQLDKSAGGTMYSVRRVPCYYAKCTHSYRRPNSTIVEFSDRPLVLPDKYSGYAIRSCKKHHDWWKNKKDVGPNSCEICRGLNADDSTVSNFPNNRGIVFKICKICAEKQAETLGLPIETKRTNGAEMPPSSDGSIESPTGGSPMFAQGGRDVSPRSDTPVTPTLASYSRMNITPAPSLNILAQEVVKNPQPLDLKELVAKITERSPEQTQTTQKLQRIERELERIQSQHVQREKEIQRMRQFMPELLFQNLHHDDDGDGGEHSNEDIDISETDSDPSSDFDPTFLANAQSHLLSRATSQKEGLEFFGSSRCPFSQRIWITLLEKGLKFSFHNVSARNGKKDGIKESGLQDKEWYWMFQFHPQGHSTIPIIKHNNRTLYESTTCAEYLDEVFPQKKLMPEPAYEKSQIRLIVLFVNNEIVPLFYRILLDRDSASCAHLHQQLLDCLVQVFNLTTMSNRGAFLGGAEFTLADIALLPFFERFQTVLPHLTGFQIPQTEEYDRLRKWYEACKDRPSFVKTIPTAEATEQLIKAYSSYKTPQQSN